MNIMVKTIHTPMMLVAGAADRKRMFRSPAGLLCFYCFTVFVSLKKSTYE